MHLNDKKAFQIIGHAVMIILTLFAMLPLILILMASLTDDTALIQDGYRFFPRVLSGAAYTYIFSSSDTVLRAYGISIVLTLCGTLVSVTITTMLAYALAKKGLPGKGILNFLVFFTMLFNGGLVPTYMNYTTVFGIKNTFWALMIPSLLMNAFNVMMVKSYFASAVPEEITEAAFIDGATEFQTFYRISLPLAKPIIATIALFVGIAYWNDWNNGYIYLTKRTDLFSIQNLLNRMIKNIQALQQNANVVNTDGAIANMPAVSIRMAIAVVGILPVIIVYPFIQKNFVKGITLGGVKG